MTAHPEGPGPTRHFINPSREVHKAVMHFV